jgi:hypothetical protein
MPVLGICNGFNVPRICLSDTSWPSGPSEVLFAVDPTPTIYRITQELGWIRGSDQRHRHGVDSAGPGCDLNHVEYGWRRLASTVGAASEVSRSSLIDEPAPGSLGGGGRIDHGCKSCFVE